MHREMCEVVELKHKKAYSRWYSGKFLIVSINNVLWPISCEDRKGKQLLSEKNLDLILIEESINIQAEISNVTGQKLVHQE